jgi:hypothetical protein
MSVRYLPKLLFKNCTMNVSKTNFEIFVTYGATAYRITLSFYGQIVEDEF